MERADTISLGQAVVLAPVDGELRRRPLVDKQRRAVLVEDLLAVLVPRAASPFVVELVFDGKMRSRTRAENGLRRRARRWSSHCTLRRRHRRGRPGP